jgi:DMSO/TMAO reductase YedYZ molybdopterin-dependent catalytic subunit
MTANAIETREPGFAHGLLVGALVTAPLIALFFLGYAAVGLPLPQFDLIDWAARTLPGAVITFGIDTMVTVIRGLDLGPTDQVAKLAEQSLGTFGLFLLGVIGGGVIFAVLRQVQDRRRWVLLAAVIGLLLALPLLLISLSLPFQLTDPLIGALWVLGTFALWGAVIGAIYTRLAALPASDAELAASAETLNRRQFLVRVGGSAAVMTVAGAGLAALLTPRTESTQDASTGDTAANGDSVATPEPFRPSEVEAGLTPAPGTRPEITPLAQHYRIDIATRPPVIDEASWVLPITGLVNNPLELTLEQIRAYDSQDAWVTMSCISNRIAGDLISTTRWTGVPMQVILDELDVQEEGTHIRIRSADGFDEVVAIDLIREDPRIMLAYAWDGQPLTTDHGFPLRIHIPDHYGMKQPKWITEMEVIPQWEEGYWVRRGWSADAIVRTTSVIDTVATNDIYEDEAGNLLVPVGGIAYSGAKGISRVEVSVDDGEWQEAMLKQPLSERAWVLWRYDWLFEEGSHSFAVRSYDGDGNLQILEDNPVRPDGATGIHRLSRRLQAPQESA